MPGKFYLWCGGGYKTAEKRSSRRVIEISSGNFDWRWANLRFDTHDKGYTKADQTLSFLLFLWRGVSFSFVWCHPLWRRLQSYKNSYSSFLHHHIIVLFFAGISASPFPFPSFRHTLTHSKIEASCGQQDLYKIYREESSMVFLLTTSSQCNGWCCFTGQ